MESQLNGEQESAALCNHNRSGPHSIPGCAEGQSRPPHAHAAAAAAAAAAAGVGVKMMALVLRVPWLPLFAAWNTEIGRLPRTELLPHAAQVLFSNMIWPSLRSKTGEDILMHAQNAQSDSSPTPVQLSAYTQEWTNAYAAVTSSQLVKESITGSHIETKIHPLSHYVRVRRQVTKTILKGIAASSAGVLITALSDTKADCNFGSQDMTRLPECNSVYSQGSQNVYIYQCYTSVQRLQGAESDVESTDTQVDFMFTLYTCDEMSRRLADDVREKRAR
ncbi:hypothetical protein JOB18_000234 [Solea senegalensis]|uniref:Uncharacterized protein n=1 Tax=Solea senegalensis TaxID=28829 RepID=A0AAV6PUY0_SOLSE|nr:hypothetical protein JOB18_000234 [Solea senegalensis]